MNDRLWSILIDSFPKLLGYGIKVTVPLTIFSYAIALAVALLVALIQYAKVRGLQRLCRFYIWITRGTPLLVQLYIVFFGLPSIGIPNYWGTIPMAVATFLERYDFTGKTILPLCTNEGSGMGGSEKTIRQCAPGADVKKGLPVTGSYAADSGEAVRRWLKANGLL